MIELFEYIYLRSRFQDHSVMYVDNNTCPTDVTHRQHALFTETFKQFVMLWSLQIQFKQSLSQQQHRHTECHLRSIHDCAKNSLPIRSGPYGGPNSLFALKRIRHPGRIQIVQ